MWLGQAVLGLARSSSEGCGGVRFGWARSGPVRMFLFERQVTDGSIPSRSIEVGQGWARSAWVRRGSAW